MIWRREDRKSNTNHRGFGNRKNMEDTLSHDHEIIGEHDVFNLFNHDWLVVWNNYPN